jgi:hypothetical protein
MRRRLLVFVLLVAAFGGGCAGMLPSTTPNCDAEHYGDILIIEAQSVPTAQHVPCVGALPVGWSLTDFTATNEGTHFYLDSDRAGFRAVKVQLRSDCNVRGASQVPSDTPGTEQYERIDTLGERYSGTRYYVFEGGCVTYDFDFTGDGRTELAREVSLALEFFPRAELEKLAREHGLEL